MAGKVCLITGVGPGTGTALVKRFAQGGYRIAMLARNEERLGALTESVGNTHAFPCDVAEEHQLKETLARVKEELGAPEIVIHNAVGGGWGEFDEIDPKMLNRNFQINTMALLHIAQATVPDMAAAGHGVLLATGNTSAYRGRQRFSGFAPTKAAQRILAESIARSAGPKGVHVAYVAIDAVISVPWTRERFSDKPDEYFCMPADIAEECFHVAHQPRSAWAFDVVIRPFGEVW